MESRVKVRNIFSLFDLLGYFIPGAGFWLALGALWFSSDLADIVRGCPCANRLTNIISLLSSSWIVWVVIGIVTIYLTGHGIAALSSMLLEKIIVGYILKYPTKNMLKIGITLKSTSKEKKNKKYLWNILLGYRTSMGNETVPLFRKIFCNVFGTAGKKILLNDQFNVFALCLAAVKEKCPVTYERTMNYVSSYGFARNAAMSFFLAALVNIIFFPWAYPYKWFHFAIMLSLSLLLFRQYLKFLRRVNDEVFFQFIVLYKEICKPGTHIKK